MLNRSLVVLVFTLGCGGIVPPDGEGGATLPAPTTEPTVSANLCDPPCDAGECEVAHCLDGKCAVFVADDGAPCANGLCTAGVCEP